MSEGREREQTERANIEKIELTKAEKKDKLGWIMSLYLVGLFIGALSTGIITPVRTIIQTSLGADDQLGIWMITIYTLCYAAIIPISGKLADRHGRKIVFIISIFLFGAGSVICGLSAGADSFAVLLIGRVVQAVGAGGIMPIATAEFGTSFPEEKRGMALGMVGGVYGIANVLGATAGSAIIDIFGVDKWEWIFYVNIPFCILIIVGSIIYIPNHKSEVVYKIDKIGTLLMTVIILALLYGLKNLNFFDFLHSLTERDVYPFLLAALVLIPLFVFVENKAEDPIFHIEYMKNSQIVVTLMMGLLVGSSMMGMIFIPQFAENALKISSGDGGYFVIILGLFAGAASPVSGKLIDKFGSKPILGAGFAISIIGALYLAFVATAYVNIFNVVISLVLIGLGMGLTMGTPLNYMMLRHTRDEDSNSALATLSLVRSIGTAIAPAIMVGFLAQAGATMQDDLMKALPEIPPVPKMEQQVELQPIMDQLGASDEFNEMMGDSDLNSMLNMDMSMDMGKTDKNMKLPDELLKSLQSSDVTTIVVTSKNMASYMFETNTPDVIKDIQAGISEGIDGIGEGINGISSGIDEMNQGLQEIDTGRAGIKQGIDGISQGIAGMETGIANQGRGIAALKQRIIEAEANLGTDPGELARLRAMLTQLQDAENQLSAKLETSKEQKASMEKAYNDMGVGRTQLAGALEEAQGQKCLMAEAKDLMVSMRDDIPSVFAQTEANYMKSIDKNSEKIEGVYQKILNGGFKNMFICVAIFNIIGLLLLVAYKDDRRHIHRT
ncbi:MAG: MFS transporter [Clostridiales bacterium]|nr:MFS transporter [Clostridiales bacterium]